MRRRFLFSHILVVVLAGALSGKQAVPILCYHYFVGDSTAAKSRLTETFSRFEQMLKFLLANGYQTCFPEDVESERTAIRRPVIITFDDGKKELLRAAQLMNRFGFKGIFFVIPSRIADQSSEYLTIQELKDLAATGHRIAVHGYSHESMASSQQEAAASQVQSLKVLKRAMGPDYPSDDFAFPMGHYIPSIVESLATIYRFLHTVNPGYWDGKSILLPRMLITNDNSLEFYQSFVLGSLRFNPQFRLITEEGSTSNTVEFERDDTTEVEGIELLAVSPDQDGKLYASYPLGPNLTIRGKMVVIDLKKHVERYYSSSRVVLSYALVHRRNKEVTYISAGHQHWIAR